MRHQFRETGARNSSLFGLWVNEPGLLQSIQLLSVLSQWQGCFLSKPSQTIPITQHNGNLVGQWWHKPIHDICNVKQPYSLHLHQLTEHTTTVLSICCKLDSWWRRQAKKVKQPKTKLWLFGRRCATVMAGEILHDIKELRNEDPKYPLAVFLDHLQLPALVHKIGSALYTLSCASSHRSYLSK